MQPIWLRVTYQAVEIGFLVLVGLLGALVLSDSLRLGPGWGEQGPQPGFFPFALTVLMLLGAAGVLVATIRSPDRRPFFEAREEVQDLLKVGIPLLFAIAAVRWLGLYVTSGIYLAFFMAWYGRFRWYQALAGGIVLSLLLWLSLRVGFNIPMPMSVFYRMELLPF